MARILTWGLYLMAAWFFVLGAIDLTGAMQAVDKKMDRNPLADVSKERGALWRSAATSAYPVVLLLAAAEGLRLVAIVEERNRSAER